jgi:hypothetical protein
MRQQQLDGEHCYMRQYGFPARLSRYNGQCGGAHASPFTQGVHAVVPRGDGVVVGGGHCKMPKKVVPVHRTLSA